MSAIGIGFRHHGDRAGRRVDASLRLGLGHALHAMAARLELELRVRALARDAQDHFLVAAELGRRLRHDLDLPAAGARRSACTSGRGCPANSADSSPPVPARISRKTLRSSFGSFGSSICCSSASSAAIFAFAAGVLLVGEGLHFRIARHLLGRRRRSRSARAILAEARDDRLDLRALPGQRAIAVEIARRVLGDESIASSSSGASASDSSLVRSEGFIRVDDCEAKRRASLRCRHSRGDERRTL